MGLKVDHWWPGLWAGRGGHGASNISLKLKNFVKHFVPCLHATYTGGKCYAKTVYGRPADGGNPQ